MTLAWVVGSGGLLGAALCRALRRDGTALFAPTGRFSWDNEDALRSQFRDAVKEFAIQATSTGRWELYWAAGVGTMGSAQHALEPETRAFSGLLQLLAAEPGLMATAGAVAYASSAGAIYAGSQDAVITENTPPSPTTAYAREKLKQEELARAFALANSHTSALLARISTIYGPGQAQGKQQGLLTHMARRILRNQPIQIYVPYDTIRDYIAVDDAASEMVGALRKVSKDPCHRVLTKIIASEHPTTIAEIISTFRRIARRAPRVVTSTSKLSALYSRRVQFRSIALMSPPQAPKTSLLVGISQLMMAERSAFLKSPENTR